MAMGMVMVMALVLVVQTDGDGGNDKHSPASINTAAQERISRTQHSSNKVRSIANIDYLEKRIQSLLLSDEMLNLF